MDHSLPFASGSSGVRLEPEFAEPYHAWKAKPEPGTRSALLKAVQPVLDTAVHSYGGGSAGSPTLMSRARMLTLKSLPAYDPSRGSLRNHLLGQLQGLRRIGAQQQQIISMPEQVSLDRSHLVTTENDLRDALGRDPSDSEIADHTGLSLKRLAYVRTARQAVAGSSLNTGEDENADFTPASTVPGAHRVEDAWTSFIYHDMGVIDKAIMDYALGLHGTPRLPVAQIAQRLGITASAVSQRTAKIQKQLDERYGVLGDE